MNKFFLFLVVLFAGFVPAQSAHAQVTERFESYIDNRMSIAYRGHDLFEHAERVFVNAMYDENPETLIMIFRRAHKDVVFGGAESFELTVRKLRPVSHDRAEVIASAVLDSGNAEAYEAFMNFRAISNFFEPETCRTAHLRLNNILYDSDTPASDPDKVEKDLAELKGFREELRLSGCNKQLASFDAQFQGVL